MRQQERIRTMISNSAENASRGNEETTIPVAQKGGDEADVERRRFLSRAGLATLAGSAAIFSTSFESGGEAAQLTAPPLEIAPATGRHGEQRLVHHAAKLRADLAHELLQTPIAAHPSNGDEARYPSYIGSDTRGLPHNQRGEVDRAAYRLALHAYETGRPEDFEAIPLAGTRKQPNPLGTLAVSLTGLNVAQFAIPPAHALASAERATEAVELYWQALLRDVPFFEFRDDTSHRGLLAATAELGRLQAGPWRGARLTPSTLFRGSALYLDESDPSNRSGRHVVPPGVLVGPYVSQFLLRDIPYGTQYISARIRVPTQDSEFLTDYAEWLNVQNGNLSGRAVTFQSTPRYIATGRDLAEYVHGGAAAFWAAALLLAAPATGAVPGFGTPLNPSNPYLRSRTQAGAAGTFALGYFQGLLPLAVSRAIRAAYWQKFFVQRALRPEAYGGLVHHKLAHNIDAYPIHAALTGSEALARSFAENGSYLLPHTYPEGAPLHSAYPAGSAVGAGVSVTLLKAFYDENAVIPDPVQVSPDDPTRLIPYTGRPLTVGGELNKLAAHYGIGRAWAGIHWRSDAAASLALGESIAIGLLGEERRTFRENFDGFTFTRFDGVRVTV
jgi:hypothetical protein